MEERKKEKECCCWWQSTNPLFADIPNLFRTML